MPDEELRRGWVALYHQTGNATLVCRHFAISPPTLRKWLRRFAEEGDSGLAARSHAPLTTTGRPIPPQIEPVILQVRRERGLGLRRLQAALREEHGIAVGLDRIRDVLKRHEAPRAAPGRPPRRQAAGATSRIERRLPALPHGDGIAARLADAIARRHLLPGSRLGEAALCRALAASRAAVRQALRDLAAVGLVNIMPHRGAFVASPAPRAIAEAYAARCIVEAEIVAGLARAHKPTDLAALQRHVALQLAASGDRARLVRLLTEFHLLLASLGTSRVLEEIVERLVSQTSVAVLLHDTEVCASHGVADHARLVELIAAGDAEGAAALMRRHLAHNQNRLRFPGEVAAGA